ncbi:unnamed protein product [Trichogramma brassicae]|uniref:Uncharacterized protein n=1 Tax=Trichogramma brassicae TaxID=86971 RepID=A0A6H5IC57_9HYME|nr:unnamed protein product [Trichogramma brassicae]
MLSVHASDRLDPKPLVRFVTNTGYKDEPKVDQNGEIILRRTTPIHIATIFGCFEVLDDLFQIYDRFDVNYTDDDDDSVTHFHAACEYGLYDVIEKFLEFGQDPNCVWRETGDTPLLWALMRNQKEVAELLLKHGADPNLANGDGLTPLHFICEYGEDDYVEIFFKINEGFDRQVQLEVRDNSGNTPLLSALKYGKKKLAESLLRRGADPTVVNANGETPLHIVCQRLKDSDELAKMFFKVNEELNHTLQIDARDDLGNTPLHLALYNRHSKTAEVLLKRDADPNLANAEGLTPLHIICDGYSDADGLAEFFFEINKNINRTVEIDAKDKLGRTPLELAVLRLAPETLDVLLKYGADLFSFPFPSESYFTKGLVPAASKRVIHCSYMNRLKIGSRALFMIDMLENRGYKLNRGDALKIMGFFAKYRFFYEPMNLDTSWYDEEEFANKAKEIMMKPNLSLYDLVKLRPEEAEKKLAYSDYINFVSSYKWLELPENLRQACAAHLCETMSRGFFRRWALDSFSELTRQTRHARLMVFHEFSSLRAAAS